MRYSTYHTLNLDIPTYSKRSYLCQLEPIGLDTSCVESLTSYVTRLAEAHCVPTGILLSRVIVPSFNKNYLNNWSERGLGELFNRSKTLNAIGRMSQDLVNSLQQFTYYGNLSSLTLERYKQVFCLKNLLHNFKTWCPLCYQDNYDKKKPIYEPLFWTINSVKICPIHNTLLHNCCPHCYQQQLWLSWYSRTGYCSHCHKWLGSDTIPQIYLNNRNYLLDTSLTIQNFLKTSSEEITLIQTEDISKSLKAVIELTCQGNIALFSRILKLPKNTVWMWCKGKSKPRLEELLYISFVCNLSILEFFKLSFTTRESLIIHSERLYQQSHQPRQSPKNIDIEYLQNTLQEFLDSEVKPPLTMEEVAQKVGYSRRTIASHLPELCKAISAKHQRYREVIRNQKIEITCQEVRKAVTELSREGIYPSESQVSKRITQPGYLRYKIVRKAFNDAREQTNLSSNSFEIRTL